MTVTMGHSKSFGLRDVKITSMDGLTQVDLPASQKLTVTPRFTTGELMGDDAIQSVISYIIGADFDFESGGIPISALALMTDKTASLAGVTPDQTLTLTWEAGDVIPYFKVYGKAISEETDDVHVKLFKCKLTTPPSGDLKGENFYINKCSGTAIDDGSNGIIDIVQNETAGDLPTS